ncbi:MAG: hypothetical protein M1286_02315 [Candidatus Marsarchaeota archaeon]|nr:hypothetical protein [Candidatus Marsarchaeota archaeon]
MYLNRYNRTVGINKKSEINYWKYTGIGGVLALSITTEGLFSALQQEKSAGELMPLQHDFYAQAQVFLSSLKKDQTPDGTRALDNTEKILATLKNRRKQKILLYIAYNKPLPAPVPAEDEVLYNKIFAVMNKTDGGIKVSRMRITSDVPEVLTSKGKKIGPFKQGEIIEVMDNEDADFIIKNRIGEATAQ